MRDFKKYSRPKVTKYPKFGDVGVKLKYGSSVFVKVRDFLNVKKFFKVNSIYGEEPTISYGVKALYKTLNKELIVSVDTYESNKDKLLFIEYIGEQQDDPSLEEGLLLCIYDITDINNTTILYNTNIGSGSGSGSGDGSESESGNYIDEHEYVEIGGLKWATMNIGANSITDYGLFFQWGDTQGYTASQVGSGEGQKYFGWADYKYGNGTSSPGDTGMTKYNSSDGKTVLDASDDAVTAAWGGAWRMPTIEEFAALGNAIDYIDSSGNVITATDKRTTLSGITGLYVADKADHSKRLFFPAAGYCGSGSVGSVGSNGFYWSSSLYSSRVQGGRNMYFKSGGVYWQSSNSRYFGIAVRGVCD